MKSVAATSMAARSSCAPMRFQRRGGRKRIVAPDGSELAPATSPQPDGTLVKALARAWRWQKLLDDGFYASVSDIGDAENISKSYAAGATDAGELGGAAHAAHAARAVSALIGTWRWPS